MQQGLGIPRLCRSVRGAWPSGLDPKRTGHHQRGGHHEYGDFGGDISRWIAGGSPGHTSASALGPQCPFYRRDVYTPGQLFRGGPGHLHGRSGDRWTAIARQRARGAEDDDDPTIKRNGTFAPCGDVFPPYRGLGGGGPHSSSCSAERPAKPRPEHCVSSMHPGNRWICPSPNPERLGRGVHRPADSRGWTAGR